MFGQFEMVSQSIHINGIVQGVGFRPFVARLARKIGVCGWVRNDVDGVHILAQGSTEQNAEFYKRLQSDAPAPARIISIEICDAEFDSNFADSFEIVRSKDDGSRDTLICPDIATCPDCTRELFDKNDRRYHYPFINCTNCGPRFTIIEDLPYDRAATSMHEFEMCNECSHEYKDEEDRRYHAQPDACFECGPHLWWYEDGEIQVANNQKDSDELIKRASIALREGKVLAIKGLGGWHLSCDATNFEAVQKLRDRKHRPAKPLAIMVKNIEAAKQICDITQGEEDLLCGSVRPIVLCLRKDIEETDKNCEGATAQVAENIAGSLPELGLMLPSTPVQHLLFELVDFPLVMTSGNRSGEPIVAKDEDALEFLAHIADAFLGNNRAIISRYDDSVVRVRHADKKQQTVRRARGLAPAPLIHKSAAKTPTIFAAGPEQKSTFCFWRGNRAYISQHLGDLETLGAWNAWQEAFIHYSKLFDLHAEYIVCDKHPEYISSKWAREYAAENDLPLLEVQHHHAHIASVMGENGLHNPVIGIALDGTGYGDDGTIWGGEILLTTRSSFTRLWHLPQIPLLGGAAAIKDPRRIAYSILRTHGQLENPEFSDFLSHLEQRELLGQMYDKKLNSPLCSSAGRLFDGMAALLGLCGKVSYDGEAACLLEAQAQKELRAAEASIANTPQENDQEITALAFHKKIVKAIVQECEEIRDKYQVNDVALGGGCMVNRLLFDSLQAELSKLGFNIYTNIELPPNDGCISYGQAVVARAKILGE